MTKYILFFFMFSVTLITAQQSEESDPLEEPPIAESMDEAISEMSKLLEDGTLDSVMIKAFSFDGENMEQLNKAMDSLDLNSLFGDGDFSEMFQQGMQSFDMSQLDKMMQESMKMLEGIDLEEMMQGIDMSEIMKMFEGMDIQGFEHMAPTPDNQESPTKEKDKNLKKI